jgi:type IV secretory pathway VirB4 component
MLTSFFKKNNQTNGQEENAVAGTQVNPRDLVAQEKLFQEGLAKVLDLIAPSAMQISSNYLQVGQVYCKTIFVAAYPKLLTIGWIGPLSSLDLPMDISLFVHPIDTVKILKSLRKKVTQIQSQMDIEAESGRTRDPVLEMAYQNAERLRDQLQQGVERFFHHGFYITIYARDLDELDKSAMFLEAILNARSIFTKKTIFRMKDGFVSTIPLGIDGLMAVNNMNTSPLSTSFPFISADVTSNKGILYGINRHNNSLILFDRFSLENHNMVIFARSGAGKSYAVKLEVLRSLMMGTTVIIIDPEDEYRYLAEAVGGTFIKISLNSPNHINPFGLPIEKDKDMAEILRTNSAYLLGLLKVMFGSITPEEDSILERAIKEAYAIRDVTEQTSLEQLSSITMPTLSDLYEVLRSMRGAEDLTVRLEKYTQGIFSGFMNQQTNINLESQLVVFNIRDLEDELRPVAMYLILYHIWNEIRSNIKKRLVVIDEAWWMMQYDDAAAFLAGVAKRIRKYYGGMTTITQDISDFVNSRHGKPIVNNAALKLLLKQSESSIDAIADLFYLTEREKYLLLESNVGEGIFFAGLKRAAIQVVASYNEDKLVTSNPAQRMEIEREKELEA